MARALALLVVAAALPVLAPAAAPAAARRCPGVADGTGGPADRVRASGTTCRAATTVIHSWQASDECYSGQAEDCSILRYRCVERSSGLVSHITCRRGKRAVTWRQMPV
jgi:hypothetical protein